MSHTLAILDDVIVSIFVKFKVVIKTEYIESVISGVICRFFIGVSYGEIKKQLKIWRHAPFRRAYL